MILLRAAIFDLDGTLIDSLADISASMNRALARIGAPVHGLEAYRHFIGEGVEKLAERALPAGSSLTLRDELIRDYRGDYAEHALDQTRLFEGIASMLDELCERRIKLAILSNKPNVPTRALAQSLLSRWPFEAVLGERADVPRKPDPTAALEIAQTLGLAPSACVFVGDTRIDMGTAVAAGMTPVGVSWGFREREELLAAGAERVLESAGELLQLFS